MQHRVYTGITCNQIVYTCRRLMEIDVRERPCYSGSVKRTPKNIVPFLQKTLERKFRQEVDRIREGVSSCGLERAVAESIVKSGGG